MNIEEKAIEVLKYCKGKRFSAFDKIYFDDETNMCVYQAIETLLTAYEKEKETNKQIKCKLDEKNIPIETLLAEFERLEDLEDDLTTVYLNGVYDGEKKVQDKIKAKIEELEIEQESNREDLKIAIDNLSFQNIDKIVDKISINMSVREILQSLLEKE